MPMLVQAEMEASSVDMLVGALGEVHIRLTDLDSIEC